MKQKWILASASPRRKEIFSTLGLDFEVIASKIEETVPSNIVWDIIPEELATQKAIDISLQYPDQPVWGFDTLVFLDQTPLGKPDDPLHASQILNSLSGKSHQVITGVSLCQAGTCLYRGHEKTTVHFKKTSQKEINDYIDSGEPFDKAGAYGIQEKGARFVEWIHGCYYNVVGLPVTHTLREMERFLEKTNGE